MTFGLRRVHAFSLVELTLALGIAAFCLLAVFGLMPIGVQTNRNATSQTAAANIMAAVGSDLRAASKLYDNLKTYSVGDQVFSSGNCYVAIVITNGHPPPNPTYWTDGSPCPRFGISFGTNTTLYFDDAGQASPSLGTNARYRLNVTWYVANATGACSPALPCADLKVSWPAMGDPATPSGAAEVLAAFDRH